jgi:phosphomannomutase
VDSHHLLLLLVHYLHHYKGMSGKVVITFSVTDKVKRLCEHYGLPYEVTKVGFKYIAEIMTREHVLVGGEESGGIAVAGHVPERDGVWCGLLVLELMATTGKTLQQLIQEVYDLVGPFAFERDDLHLPEELKQLIVTRCKEGAYTAFGDYTVLHRDDLDGFKLTFSADEWVMIRPSGTEPVLRVYAQAPSAAQARALLQSVTPVLLATR